MKRLTTLLLAAGCAVAAQAQFLHDSTSPGKSGVPNVDSIKIKASYLSGDQQTDVYWLEEEI